MSERLKTYAALVLEQGGVWDKESPLHLTLCQPALMTHGRLQEFITLLKKNLHEFGEVTIVGAGEAMFGPRNDIPVRQIGRTAELLALHEIVLAATQEVLPQFTLDFPKYRPHVTYKATNGLHEDEQRTLREVTVLSRPEGGLWKPATTIPLQDD